MYVVTWEEKRLRNLLAHHFKADPIYIWSNVSGLRSLSDIEQVSKSTVNEIDALDSILSLPNNAIVLLSDFHHSLKDASVVRKLREILQSQLLGQRKIMIVSPVLVLPTEIEKMTTVLDFPVPNHAELESLLFGILSKPPFHNRTKVLFTKEEKQTFIDAALGLTYKEANRAFRKCLVDDRSLSVEDTQTVLEAKRQAIRKSGFLEYFETHETMEEVGGMDALKKWLTERGRAFSEDARAYGLPQPKGIMLMGVQGCGKSLVAKVISNMWKMPLIRFDMGKVFGSFIGSSESNMRKAIHTAESVSPCVLWVDEVEKAVSGMSRGMANDGGTSARVFSTFLTWLQEKTEPVFVVTTANQIDQLPPELMRKGRLDEIFFVDLPTLEERRAILNIHLDKRKQSLSSEAIETMSKQLEGFSGAEIEQAVVSAMYKAFVENRAVAEQDLQQAIEETVPLSTTMFEDIDRIRQWATQRARKVV